MVRRNSLNSKYKQYKQVMRVLDCTNYIYLEYIKNLDFKKIGSYKNSKDIFNKIYNDFCVVNEMVEKQDIINSAVILRGIFENIMYVIATSFDKNIKVTLNSQPKDFRKVLEDNCEDIFSENIDKEMFYDIYSYLCKIVHPCSLKECVTYIEKNRIYNKYILNNIKYAMVTIEFIYLDFYNKIIMIEDELCNSLNDLMDYIFFYNLIQFNKSNLKFKNIAKKYFINDTSNQYVKKQQDSALELSEYIKNNPGEFNSRRDTTIKKVEDVLNKSIYKETFLKIWRDE